MALEAKRSSGCFPFLMEVEKENGNPGEEMRDQINKGTGEEDHGIKLCFLGKRKE